MSWRALLWRHLSSRQKKGGKVARQLFPLSFREKKAGQRKGSQTLTAVVCDTRGVARMKTLWAPALRPLRAHTLRRRAARDVPAWRARRGRKQGIDMPGEASPLKDMGRLMVKPKAEPLAIGSRLMSSGPLSDARREAG
jgi:hypothetical protein